MQCDASLSITPCRAEEESERESRLITSSHRTAILAASHPPQLTRLHLTYAYRRLSKRLDLYTSLFYLQLRKLHPLFDLVSHLTALPQHFRHHPNSQL